MTISLRELFVLIAFVSLAVGGLLTGPPMSWIALVVFALLLLTKLVDCLVCSGQRRHFSIGFSIFATFYLGLCMYLGSSEFFAFNYEQSKLPTSRLVYVCLKPDYKPAAPTNPTTIAQNQLRADNGHSLFPMGHLATACAFGYFGGWYARFATRERNKPE